jgi:hypothetical protein
VTPPSPACPPKRPPSSATGSAPGFRHRRQTPWRQGASYRRVPSRYVIAPRLRCACLAAVLARRICSDSPTSPQRPRTVAILTDGRRPAVAVSAGRQAPSGWRHRLDLTLECIRRHYLGQTSPLADLLSRYSEFFALYGDFRGYVDFFLLQDLTNTDYSVKFFLPFENFTTPAVPLSVAQYTEYRQRSFNFVQARNQRIASSCRLQR